MYAEKIQITAISNPFEYDLATAKKLAEQVKKDGVLATPIQVKTIGRDEAGFPLYEVVPEFSTAVEAMKILHSEDTMIELVLAWVDKDFSQQNRLLAQAAEVKVEVKAEAKAEGSAKKAALVAELKKLEAMPRRTKKQDENLRAIQRLLQ